MQSYSHIKINHISTIMEENILLKMAPQRKKIQHTEIKIIRKTYGENYKCIKWHKIIVKKMERHNVFLVRNTVKALIHSKLIHIWNVIIINNKANFIKFLFEKKRKYLKQFRGKKDMKRE